MMFVYCMLLLALIHITAALDWPSYVKKCKKDENINTCLKENIEAIKPHLLNGIPQLYIPSLNPLRLKDLKMETQQFSFIAHVYNLEHVHNFDVKEVDLNLNECSMKLTVLFPYLQATGQYSMKGRIILLTLEGAGDAYANMTNLEGTIYLKGVKESKGGKEFINFNDTKMSIKLTPTNYIYLENIFGPNKELSKTLNEVINQNSMGFLKELEPFVKMASIEIFKRTIETIFSRNAVDDLFI